MLRRVQRLREVAGFYASHFGVPAVMVNKAAGPDSRSPVPCVPLVRLRFHYVGQSTICDADGNVRDQLDEQEGVVFGEVALLLSAVILIRLCPRGLTGAFARGAR